MAKIATMKIWDVELGLAIHIEAPNGRYIVIDLGSKNGVSPISYLQGKDVGYMVITHPHYDHFSDVQNIGNARPRVLWRCKSYTFQELINEATTDKREIVNAYCTFVDSYTATITTPNNPETEYPFDGLTAEIFATNSCEKSNKNNFSAIVVLRLGNAKIVVCGDNEEKSLKYLMLSENFRSAVKNAWVLVAPHHGRESAYHDDFVSLVSPDITIISDTSKVSTSAADKYSEKSKGYDVYNCSTQEKKHRKCLTTRKDGNIIVRFGESDDPKYIGTLSVEING